jgi:hypothetical protein
MGVRVTVKAMRQDTGSLESHGGKLVAERWGLEYREAHTLSIDPTALEILDREASRRLGVLPLEFGPDGPVFAVAEPSEERFAAVRDLAGDNATFVVVASETLDALLNSKVFSAPNTQRRPTRTSRRTTRRGSKRRSSTRAMAKPSSSPRAPPRKRPPIIWPS